MADAAQINKVCDIMLSDADRRIVVVSAQDAGVDVGDFRAGRDANDDVVLVWYMARNH